VADEIFELRIDLAGGRVDYNPSQVEKALNDGRATPHDPESIGDETEDSVVESIDFFETGDLRKVEWFETRHGVLLWWVS
jgi:hypothetical protein